MRRLSACSPASGAGLEAQVGYSRVQSGRIDGPICGAVRGNGCPRDRLVQRLLGAYGARIRLLPVAVTHLTARAGKEPPLSCRPHEARPVSVRSYRHGLLSGFWSRCEPLGSGSGPLTQSGSARRSAKSRCLICPTISGTVRPHLLVRGNGATRGRLLPRSEVRSQDDSLWRPGRRQPRWRADDRTGRPCDLDVVGNHDDTKGLAGGIPPPDRGGDRTKGADRSAERLRA